MSTFNHHSSLHPPFISPIDNLNVNDRVPTKAKAMVILEPSMGVESVTSSTRTSIDSTKDVNVSSSSSPSTTDNNNNRFNTSISISSNTIAIDSTDNDINTCSSQNEFEMRSPRDDSSSSSQVEFETDTGKAVDENNGSSNGRGMDQDGSEQERSQDHDNDVNVDNDNDEGQVAVAVALTIQEDEADFESFSSGVVAVAVEMILQDDSNDDNMKEGVRLPQDPQNDGHCHSNNDDTDDTDIRTSPNGNENENENENGNGNENATSPSRKSDNVHDSTSSQSLYLRDISLDESEFTPHSPDAQTAKDLILTVTNEDEQEEYDSQENDTDDESNEQQQQQQQQQQQHDASIMKKNSHLSSSSPLRLSTDFAQLTTNQSNAGMKSPMRSESPAMRRRREELNKSQKSIQQLEEQLNLVPKDTFQPFQPDYDDGESLDNSTITSTPSLGLLFGSSRTLLTNSSKFINDSQTQVQMEQHHVRSPKRQQSTKKVGSPELRKVFAAQRDSSRLLQSPTRQSSAKSFGDETIVTNNASPPKAVNNNNNDNNTPNEFEKCRMTPHEVDQMRAFYEKKLANQRHAHEDQIDEIIEQLNSIETTYGKEIGSLKDRLSKKEIMTEALTNSLTSYQIKNGEIKQQYEITLTKLDEARQEFEAEHERYAALMRELEREKMKAVEAAREEIRVAAERQFASAQKTFVKLKQDFNQCSEERDFFEQKHGALEIKERAQEATISTLMAESADSNAKMATEKAEALKMKVEIEKSVNSKIEKAERKCAEAYALAGEATEAKEALKKENSELQSLCEELMAIVEGGRAK